MSKAYDISFQFDLESARMGLSADVDLASYIRVVENLVGNASKAGATTIRVVDRVTDGKIRTEWTDNGGGCADVLSISTGWTTSDEDGAVHGTGTKLMRELIENMGGEIAWSANEGGGLTVTITVNVSK
jgi:signal transduction histidine kinase